MSQLETVDLKGKEYALVPTRLKAFREENPRAEIKATPHWNPDGSLDFETKIVRDRSDEYSAIGNGWAHYSAQELKNPKAYEKLQTISKGRALADIGYLNNGQIATTEELEEFNDYKEQKRQEALKEAEAKLTKAETLGELKAAFMSLSGAEKAELTGLKDELKAKLEAKNASSKD